MECDDLLFLPINVLNCHYHIIVNQVFMNLIPNMSHFKHKSSLQKYDRYHELHILLYKCFNNLLFSQYTRKSGNFTPNLLEVTEYTIMKSLEIAKRVHSTRSRM
jgi:hypothetical protein